MNGTPDTPDKWKIRFERERKARQEAEQLLETKSRELYDLNRRLEEQVRSQDSRLIEQEELFASVFHASMDGIILLNGRGRVIEANHAVLRMLGYSRDLMMGVAVPRLLAQKDQATARNALRQVIETGYCRYEADLIRVDGSTFPSEIVGSRTQVGGKTIIKGTIRDITQRRRNLAELKLARDEAEKANAAKSLFLASMSHEIRTPLNGVLGFTELVLETKLSEDQRRHLEIVKSSGDILLQIINDLLDFSRIESGKLLLEEKNYSLRKVVEEVIAMQSLAIKNKNLALSFHINKDIPEVIKGDIIRVRQVITNLVSNAIKFTHEGAVSISVFRREDQVQIDVTDTGVGFDNAVADTLFESFTQADVSTTRKFGGTGLGLAICRKLAWQMDGDIKAHGEQGEGSTFSFIFPLVVPKSRPGSKRTVEDVPASRVQEQGAATRVLVAEDNQVNARLIVIMLKRLGYHPEVVSNGRMAVEKLITDPGFAVILMDRHMQDIDGIEATRQIREGKAGPESRDIPIIAVTASTLTDDREKCLAAGMNGFLAKPLRASDLEAQLSSILGRPGTGL